MGERQFGVLQVACDDGAVPAANGVTRRAVLPDAVGRVAFRTGENNVGQEVFVLEVVDEALPAPSGNFFPSMLMGPSALPTASLPIVLWVYW